MNAYIEVIHCMKCYLRDTLANCSNEYYNERKAEVLAAAKEVVDAPSYKALLIMVKDMEGRENA